MADLIRHADWVNEFEERAAEVLCQELPATWIVIYGKRIPNLSLNEIDFIVVGENKIFVIDAKHWGPRIVADEIHWVVNGDQRKSPIVKNDTQRTHVLEMLRKYVKSFKQLNTDLNALVDGYVFLTYPHLELKERNLSSAHKAKILFSKTLSNSAEDICEVLIKRDQKASIQGVLRSAREDVIKYCTGWDDKTIIPKVLGSYQIKKHLGRILDFQKFLGENEYYQNDYILRCHPIHSLKLDNSDGLGVLSDPSYYRKNESKVLGLLQENSKNHSVWSPLPPFQEPERDWEVWPFQLQKGALNLLDATAKKKLPRFEELLQDEVRMASFFVSALETFESIAHFTEGKSLIHRLLAPDRIYILPDDTFLFTEFLGARIVSRDEQSEPGTVIQFVRGDESSKYWRAPECVESFEDASEKSDLYSLVLIISEFLAGEFRVDPDETLKKFESLHSVSQILKKIIAENEDRRLTIEEAIEEFSKVKEIDSIPIDSEIIEGATVNDRYEVLTRLSGGNAKAWKARDIHMRDNLVVLKQIEHRGALDAELQSAMALRKQNIAGLSSVQNIIEELNCLVYDYIEGETLDKKNSLEKLSCEQIRTIMCELLLILDKMHNQNYFHGDIKPSNIVVDDDFKVSLIDVGISNTIGQVPIGRSRLYAAPEVLEKKGATAQSDLYSLAKTALYLILNRNPDLYLDTTENDLVTIPGLSSEEVDSFSDIDKAIITAFMEGIARDPSDRPESALAFKSRLQEAEPPPILLEQSEAFDLHVNDFVTYLRSGYRYSRAGASKMLGLDLNNEFDLEMYVDTKLDTYLMPDIVSGKFKIVILTGNPGDGKTAFLEKLKAELKLESDEVSEDKAGWKVIKNGQTFEAIMDASESHNGESSSSRIANLLKLSKSPQTTVLLAMNDGRMRKFFEEYQRDFPLLWTDVDNFLNFGSAPESGGFVIVDLKKRSLMNLDRTGLTAELIERAVKPELWESCNTCLANPQCPIFQNRNRLASSAKLPIEDLVLSSHFRRIRRSTVRDLRSALGWIITGDRNCEEIHEAHGKMRNLLLGNFAKLSDLTFSKSTKDNLISEWSDLDPALQSNPKLERQLRKILRKKHKSITIDSIGKEKRKLFMRDSRLDATVTDSIFAYQHFDQFTRALQNPQEISLVRDVLMGISRILSSSPLIEESGMAIGESNMDSGWTVLKLIPAQDFRIEVLPLDTRYVESVPDKLILSHVNFTATSLEISLDLFELIMKARYGYIVSDESSRALKTRIEYFASALTLAAANQVIVLSPSRQKSVTELKGKQIVLRDTHGN